MADSTHREPTGNQAASKRQARYFVAGVPDWWDPEKLPGQVLAAVSNYGDKLDPQQDPEAVYKNGLLFFGSAGFGKTSVALLIAYIWGKAGKYARFQDFDELMLRHRAAWRRNAEETTADIHTDMLAPDLLILDDVGKRISPEAAETVSALVNSRINRNRPTILTTNCDLTTRAGVEQFCQACDSRVLERYRGLDVNASIWGINLREGR